MSSSDDDEAVQRVILGLGRDVFAAIRRKDVASLRRVLAEDFVHRGADGSETGRDEFLRGVSDLPLEVTSIRGEHLRVDIYGQVAVMTGVQHAGWRQDEAAEGVSSVAFVDVFVLRGGEWRMVLAYGAELRG